ncbi:hypothetical protein PV328_012138 [Microctonus aethiopoides]|uniref:Uncharacterized protein n=1 Tax=Microctonus aethiopoides TaxID=144406 RepID=A0AA39FH00_9HYME|nr:hypothetical protein PV328_012138 [Microctonus aethiopoides]
MIHIPMEWIDANIPNIDLLNDIYCRVEEYAAIHGFYEGCVMNINNVNAALFINNTAKIWWYKRIQPDDDLPHPPIENYHPPLAPEDLERQWSQSQDSGFEE